jgi:anti-sigma B factor antagonist
MGFRLEVSLDGTVVVLALHGEFDVAYGDLVAQATLDHLATGGAVYADLSGLTFIDSSGLGALVRGWQDARRLGATFGVRGATGQVARLLEVTGLEHLLVERDPAAAVGPDSPSAV